MREISANSRVRRSDSTRLSVSSVIISLMFETFVAGICRDPALARLGNLNQRFPNRRHVHLPLHRGLGQLLAELLFFADRRGASNRHAVEFEPYQRFHL